MKKLLYLTLILSCITPCYANPSADFKTSPTNPNIEYNSAVMVDKEVDGLDALVDIPLRISGFLTTVVGTGAFVAISPIAGLMATYPPHDATDKIIDFLILEPARYTFDRPVGDFNYKAHEYKAHQIKTNSNTDKDD